MQLTHHALRESASQILRAHFKSKQEADKYLNYNCAYIWYLDVNARQRCSWDRLVQIHERFGYVLTLQIEEPNAADARQPARPEISNPFSCPSVAKD
jgi:hypothetical protein